MEKPEPDDPNLIDALVQSSFVVVAALSTLAATHDLSLTQLRVLAILRDRRLRMAGLAGYLGLERSTLSGLVDRAEKRGLLKRAPSAQDGRAIEVFLAPEGQELAERIAVEAGAALAPLTASITPGERAHLTRLLEGMLSPEARPEGTGRASA